MRRIVLCIFLLFSSLYLRATSTLSLEVYLHIPIIAPTFKALVSNNASMENAVEISQSESILNSEDDITEKDLRFYIEVIQTNMSKYIGGINLNLSFTPLYNRNGYGKETNLPSINTIDKYTSESLEIKEDLSEEINICNWNINLNYIDGKAIESNTKILEGEITYHKKENLSVGNYIGKITLRINAL